MKKRIASWLFITFIVIVACDVANEITPESLEQNGSKTSKVIITAQQIDGDATKTIRDGLVTKWLPGDRINVFCGSDGGVFTSRNTTNATQADFEGELLPETASAIKEGTNSPIFGLYPYDGNATFKTEYGTSYVYTTLPAEQTAVAGSFADDLLIMLAKSNNTQLSFKNVCSGFKFSLTQSGVTSITLKGRNNEDIAGKIRLYLNSSGNPVSYIVNGQKTITLTPQGGGSFQTGQEYYFVMVPKTLSKGFEVTLNKANGTAADFVVKKSVSFARSQFVKKLSVDAGLSYVIPVTDVSLDRTTLTLAANTSTTLHATVLPVNAGDKSVTWTSSNPDAVTVDQDGNITAKTGGSSMITVTTTNREKTASCVVTVKPTDIHFNPDGYIVYRKNNEMYFVGDDQYNYESYFTPSKTGDKIEFKFQIGPIVSYAGTLLAADMNFSTSYGGNNAKISWIDYREYDHEEHEWDESSYPFILADNGIGATDLMTVTIDKTANTVTINGKTATNTSPLFGETSDFFSYYERDYDEGWCYWYEGTIDGTKLYYIVIRNSNNTIIQEGYADRATNPETGNVEYCWCWRAANGTKTYNFAHKAGSYGAYEGYIP